MFKQFRLGIPLVVFLVFFSSDLISKTRWSAVQYTPNADMLAGGQLVVDAHALYVSDTGSGLKIRPGFFVDLGLIEWVNVEFGFAGVPTLGFKARILAETRPYLPTLTIGARNILGHSEAGYFKASDSLKKLMNNEVYCVLAKGIDAIKTRIHLGVQSIPNYKQEVFNPFIALESYYGAGLYSSLEIARRHEQIVPSLFLSWRFIKRNCELTAGLVALDRLLFDKGDFRFTLSTNKPDTSFVKPSIWFGLKYSFRPWDGKKGGFETLEESVARHQASLDEIKTQLDSMNALLRTQRGQVVSIEHAIAAINDSLPSDKARLKILIMDKLIELKNLYGADPYEPEKVKETIRGLALFRDKAMPVLKEIALDKTEDRDIRTESITILGEIGSSASSDALLTLVASETDTKIKIETLIALGKIKETQAIYMMEQLANDPDDAVALTAQEVLFKLAAETGIHINSDFGKNKRALSPPAQIKSASVKDSAQSVTPLADTLKPAPIAKPVETVVPSLDTVSAVQNEPKSKGESSPTQAVQVPTSQAGSKEATSKNANLNKSKKEKQSKKSPNEASNNANAPADKTW